MGHNLSRYLRATPDCLRDVDAYKARSIWGSWRRLRGEVRALYFNADETAWIDRYGARLDQIACMAVEPRNEREKHFLAVCLDHSAPTGDRERLGLRAHMVVRYEDALERAARCEKAEHIAFALTDQLDQMHADFQDCETKSGAQIPVTQMLWAQVDSLNRRLQLRNVDRVPAWCFNLRSPEPIC